MSYCSSSVSDVFVASLELGGGELGECGAGQLNVLHTCLSVLIVGIILPGVPTDMSYFLEFL